MTKQPNPFNQKDPLDMQALSPEMKAYLDQHIQDAIKKQNDSHSRRKKWINSWRGASPLTKANLILAAALAVSTIIYTFVAWRTLKAMRDISNDSTQQAEKLIDAATQIKNAGWVFSGAAQGTNNAVWGAVGSLNAQNKTTDAMRRSSEEASRKALDATIDNFKQEQRAWLKVSFEPFSAAGSVKETLSNIGKSPILQSETHAWLEIVPMTQAPSLSGDGIPERTVSPLYPGDVFPHVMWRYNSDLSKAPFTTGEQELLMPGFAYVAVYGIATYTDQFGEHWTKFCMPSKGWATDPARVELPYRDESCEKINTFGDGKFDEKSWPHK